MKITMEIFNTYQKFEAAKNGLLVEREKERKREDALTGHLQNQIRDSTLAVFNLYLAQIKPL